MIPTGLTGDSVVVLLLGHGDTVSGMSAAMVPAGVPPRMLRTRSWAQGGAPPLGRRHLSSLDPSHARIADGGGRWSSGIRKQAHLLMKCRQPPLSAWVSPTSDQEFEASFQFEI